MNAEDVLSKWNAFKLLDELLLVNLRECPEITPSFATAYNLKLPEASVKHTLSLLSSGPLIVKFDEVTICFSASA